MLRTHLTPANIQYSNKDIEFKAQTKAVQEYLSHHVATATMTAAALGIYRPNLCRIKRILEKKGLLTEVSKGLCKITGFPAAYLSCNAASVSGYD